jgi:hypothetical protein
MPAIGQLGGPCCCAVLLSPHASAAACQLRPPVSVCALQLRRFVSRKEGITGTGDPPDFHCCKVGGLRRRRSPSRDWGSDVHACMCWTGGLGLLMEPAFLTVCAGLLHCAFAALCILHYAALPLQDCAGTAGMAGGVRQGCACSCPQPSHGRCSC